MRKRSAVVVNLKTGKAFQGVYWARSREYVVLKASTVIEGNKRTGVDGEVHIPRANIDFVQKVSA